MTALNCMGGCGRRVTHEGKWCASCWFPEAAEPVKSGNQIREEILRAAFVLRFGTQTEQADATETLAHLINVVQHSTLTQTNPT